MKKYLSFIILVMPFTSIAQSIKIKKQDVFVNDSPYCKLDGKTGLAALTDVETNFTVTSLQGNELIYVKSVDEQYLNVTFVSDGTKIKVKRSNTQQAGDRKYFIKMIVASKLIQGDTINEEAKRLFILKNDETEEYQTQSQPASASTGDYTIVERNTNADVWVSNESITQDNKVIGTYKSESEAINGDIQTTVTFYLSNGTNIARLTAPQFHASNNTFLVLKDNKLLTLDLSGDMIANENDNIKKAANWLIERGYL
jgi:hypothetical protein